MHPRRGPLVAGTRTCCGAASSMTSAAQHTPWNAKPLGNANSGGTAPPAGSLPGFSGASASARPQRAHPSPRRTEATQTCIQARAPRQTNQKSTKHNKQITSNVEIQPKTSTLWALPPSGTTSEAHYCQRAALTDTQPVLQHRPRATTTKSSPAKAFPSTDTDRQQVNGATQPPELRATYVVTK